MNTIRALLFSWVFSLLPPFLGLSAANGQTITITISTCIDGENRLIIQGNNARWQYISYDPVGTYRDDCTMKETSVSTTLNGSAVMSNVNVQPVWTNNPPNSGDISAPLLSALAPALPDTDMSVTLTALQARESITISQYPSAANNQTLILDFNDNSSGGAAVYTAQITVTPNVPAYNCHGFHAPFSTPLTLNNKTNRAIPLAAQLTDAGNNPVTPTTLGAAAPPVVNISFSSTTVPATDETSLLDPLGRSSNGNQFNFDPSTGNWWFNLATTPFTSSGSYTASLQSGDVTKYLISPQCSGIFVRR